MASVVKELEKGMPEFESRLYYQVALQPQATTKLLRASLSSSEQIEYDTTSLIGWKS